MTSMVAACSKSGKDVVLLDGGMGHQLRARGVEISGPVGSMRRFLGVAMANVEAPDLVIGAHLDYIDAGAQVLTTNNYSCVPRCLEMAPDSDKEAFSVENLVRRAGELAREACRQRPDREVKVAGCLPPLGESYRPDKVGEYDQIIEDYRVIAKNVAPFSDVLLIETMSTAAEACAALAACVDTGLPVWVAWTLDERHPVLRSGESIEEAVAALLNVPGARSVLQACLFNCASPEIMTEAMPMLIAAVPDGVRTGGYANGFVTCTSGEGEYRDLTGEEYFDGFVSRWLSDGATIVGGCCGIFPRHIAVIRDKLARRESMDLGVRSGGRNSRNAPIQGASRL